MTDTAGRNAEFDVYVTSASGRLFRLAYLLEGTVADAEDLVQETLLRALRAWWRVQSADDADKYVSRMMINLHRSRLRRLRLAVTPGENRSPRDDIATVDDRWDLACALRSLPRRQRQVIVLRYFEDRSEESVADLLGCSVGSVKRQAARARVKLRAHPALQKASGHRLTKGSQ